LVAFSAAGDEEAEAAALEVCKEAEIQTILPDSKPAPPPVYLDSTPKSFLRWRNRNAEQAEAASAAAADESGAGTVSSDLTD
jgi:hypothetical protein